MQTTPSDREARGSLDSMPYPKARAIETAGRTVGRRLRPRADKMFVECERAWLLMDGYGQVLGRLASKIVPLLCGKHKPIFQPQRDVGDYVVVTNVASTVVTGKKLDQKMYYRHSGYPGGLKATSMRELINKNAVEPLRRAVLGMLPKNKLRGQRMRRLRLFPGPEHIHDANLKGDLAFQVTFPPDDAPAKLVPVSQTKVESP